MGELALAVIVAVLVAAAFGRRKDKTITGWLTVTIPAKKKGRKK